MTVLGEICGLGIRAGMFWRGGFAQVRKRQRFGGPGGRRDDPDR